jgi:predicted amidohydrolase
MRIAVVQTNPRFGEVKANVQIAIRQMGGTVAECYVLPELFNTGYNFVDRDEVESLAEPVDGPTGVALRQFAEQHTCHIVYGFAERADGQFYNSAALIGPNGLVGLYRKVHLFFRETLFFAPGNLGFPVFECPFGKVGMMVCFDWMYPESARSLALRGAQLIAHPSNLVLPYCPDAMVTRCLENRVYAATANRVGTEDRGGLSLTYIGRSEIVTPRGEILGRLGSDQPGVELREVDLQLANDKRINGFNDLFADRKVEQYGW